MTMGEAFAPALDAAVAGESWAWCSLFADGVEDLTRYVKASGAIPPEPVVAAVFSATVGAVHRFSGDEQQWGQWLRSIARARVRAYWQDGGAPESRGFESAENWSWLSADASPAMTTDQILRIELLVQQLSIVPFHPAFPAAPLASTAGHHTGVHEDSVITAHHGRN